MTTPPPAVLAPNVALERLAEIVGSMRNFADVADRCELTEGNAPAAIRSWSEMLTDLTPSLAQKGEAKPFAWFTDDYRDDKSATTYGPVVAERWRNKGWPVSPLFANHASADEAAIIAAYKRGAQWALENGAICAPYLGKAARDYADKTAALQPAASKGENNG